MTPDVSVLLPARDAAATFGIALRSVLRARDVALEVIVVEHGSVDDTPAVVQRWAARDARVRVLHVPRDVPFATALEQGRVRARAPFIARMDADDVMHPHRLRDDVACLRAHDAIGAVSCRVKVIPRGALRMRSYVAWQNALLTDDDNARDVWIEQPLCHPATTLRNAAVDVIGGYRAGAFPEDYDLFLRLHIAGFSLRKRPAVHHAWRQHDAMTTRTSPRHTRDVIAALKAEHLVARFGLAQRDVVIAGAGKEGRRIARALASFGVRPAAFVDVDPHKIGRVTHGAPVHPSSSLVALVREGRDPFVVAAIGTSGARGVVRAALVAAGLRENTDAVVVA